MRLLARRPVSLGVYRAELITATIMYEDYADLSLVVTEKTRYRRFCSSAHRLPLSVMPNATMRVPVSCRIQIWSASLGHGHLAQVMQKPGDLQESAPFGVEAG